MLLCPGVTQARCPVPGHSRNGSDSESLSPLIPRACTACIKRTPLFCTGFQPVSGAARRQGMYFFLPRNSFGSFTRLRSAPVRFTYTKQSWGGDGRHRPGRGAATGTAQPRLSRGPGPGPGRGLGLGPRGLRRGRRSGGGAAAAPPARPPSTKDDRELPRCGSRAPGPPHLRGAAAPGPGSPAPGQPGTAQSRTAQPRTARLCRRRRGRSAFPSRSGAAAVWRLPAPPEVLTASSSANAGVPERLGTESRCQPNLRRCSAPRDPGAAAGSGVHLRPAPLSARAGSASPLLTTLGLIFHKSAAPVWGLLLPRQLVLCTALSPFSAISNLHALSFLRYRLILVWQSRFAILSHAHSCG